MWKILMMIFTGIIVSFYYFPFEFSFLPGINTKMGLAVVGIILSAIKLVKFGESTIPRNLVRVLVSAVMVSLVGVVSVVLNNTPDYAYATYFVSMLVWLRRRSYPQGTAPPRRVRRHVAPPDRAGYPP